MIFHSNFTQMNWNGTSKTLYLRKGIFVQIPRSTAIRKYCRFHVNPTELSIENRANFNCTMGRMNYEVQAEYKVRSYKVFRL